MTYAEIVAFSKGEPVDRTNKRSLTARKNRAIEAAVKVVLSACVGALLGIVVWNVFEAF